jgi:hypothetical protein
MPDIPDVTTRAEANYPASTVDIQTKNVGVSSSQTDNDAKREIERLRSTNSMYDKHAPLWQFFLQAYEGGKEMARVEHIFRHPREHPDDFQERAKRLYYHNYCYPLVDFFTTFIYTETIQRDGGNNGEWFNEFISDVNRKGDDITAFMSMVSDEMQIFGMTYVLVDAPDTTTLTKGDKEVPIATEADAKEAGLRPYWVTVRPTEVLDWVVDTFDKFQYLKRIERQTRIKPDLSKQKIERYTEWTPTAVAISEVDVSIPEEPVLLVSRRQVTNRLNKVPFEVIRYKRCKTDKFMGLSFLNDISFINREVMNLTSLLQEFLYRQCFNILAMEQDPNVPEIEQMQGEISTANMMKYPVGTKAPSYITPPVQPAEFLQKERSVNIVTMYKIAAQDTVNDLFNGVKSSGFSKSQSFQTTVPKIATRADSLAACEVALLKLSCEYLGKKWDGTIKYKDHYQITNLTDALSQLGTMFKDLQINSKTFAAEQMKRMVHEFDGKMTPDSIKKVYAEIEAIDWDAWFDTMQLAFIGRAAMSPEAAAVIEAEDQGNVPFTHANNPAKGVKGKDTPTAASTPQRAQSGSAEIQKESAKK